MYYDKAQLRTIEITFWFVKMVILYTSSGKKKLEEDKLQTYCLLCVYTKCHFISPTKLNIHSFLDKETKTR